MTIQISTAHNESRLNGTLSYLATGTGTAKIQIYATTRPAFGAAAGGAPLVEILLSNSIGSVASNVLELDAPDDALIATTGDAVWARVLNRNGDLAFDCDVSAAGGSGEVQIPNITLYAGGLTRLTSGILG